MLLLEMDELSRERTSQEERRWLPTTLAPESQQFPALQVTVAETLPPSLGLSSLPVLSWIKIGYS